LGAEIQELQELQNGAGDKTSKDFQGFDCMAKSAPIRNGDLFAQNTH
jgi:hypothetical protein